MRIFTIILVFLLGLAQMLLAQTRDRITIQKAPNGQYHITYWDSQEYRVSSPKFGSSHNGLLLIEAIGDKKPKAGRKTALVDTLGYVHKWFGYEGLEWMGDGLLECMSGKYYSVKHGVIDTNGKVVLKEIADNISRAQNGVFVYKIDQNHFIFDTQKNTQIALKGYSQIHPFYNMFKFPTLTKYGSVWRAIRVSDKKMTLLNNKGKAIKTPKYAWIDHFNQYGFAIINKNSKFGCIDTNFREVLPPTYKSIHARPNGTWTVQIFTPSDTNPNESIPFKAQRFGVLGKRFEWLVQPEYNEIGHFDAFAPNWSIAIKNEKWGAVDSTGAEKIPFRYDQIAWKVFNGWGAGFFKSGNGYGLMDSMGQELTKAEYEFVNLYKISPHTVEYHQNKLLGLLHRHTGEILCTAKYKSIEAEKWNQKYIFIAKTPDHKTHILDSMGREMLPFDCDFVAEENRDIRVKILHTKGKKGVFVPYEGILFPPIYEDFQFPNKKAFPTLLTVREKNLYGLIDLSLPLDSPMILPLAYSAVLGEGTHFLKMRKPDTALWGVYIPKNKLLLPLEYTGLRSVNLDFLEVRKGQQLGILDTLGRSVVPCEYELIQPQKEGFIVRKNNKWGFYSTNGQQLLPCAYERMNAAPSPDLGKYIVQQQGETQLFDPKTSTLITYIPKILPNEATIFIPNSSIRSQILDDSRGAHTRTLPLELVRELERARKQDKQFKKSKKSQKVPKN